MGERITIRPAASSDADVIASMWSEASRVLAQKGIDQWQYPANAKKISRDIERGTAYIVHDFGVNLGTITVDESANPKFWTPEDAPTDALYAHRVIVLPFAKGRSVGASMLDWASQKARKAGKSWLRVDAWKTNAQLGSYYQRQGFTHVRTVDLPNRRSGALYQRPAGVVTGTGPGYVSDDV
ncbi:GNAT family N-acetyltransferase [Streptomyces odonnellii]|uniref:GNAT family N-acetyltransferase n=1 Tax=Streptomyces odonnellii TaxID=1417980 RepID=UPI00062650B1|nr:GNAT family N-acetyltransferase [Streptomyces odonnellii]